VLPLDINKYAVWPDACYCAECSDYRVQWTRCGLGAGPPVKLGELEGAGVVVKGLVRHLRIQRKKKIWNEEITLRFVGFDTQEEDLNWILRGAVISDDKEEG
jgi:hypothetical protein